MYPLVVRPLMRQLLYKVCIWSDFTCLKVIQIPVFFSRSATYEATFIQSLYLSGFYMLKSDSNSWNSPVSTRNRRIYQKSTTSRGWQFFDVNFWPKSNMQNSAYSRSATHEATFIQSLYLAGFYMFKSDSNSSIL